MYTLQLDTLGRVEESSLESMKNTWKLELELNFCNSSNLIGQFRGSYILSGGSPYSLLQGIVYSLALRA